MTAAADRPHRFGAVLREESRVTPLEHVDEPLKVVPAAALLLALLPVAVELRERMRHQLAHE